MPPVPSFWYGQPQPAYTVELAEGLAMRLTLDQFGDWIVDPIEIAIRLNMTELHLRFLMKLGLVTSRIEAGSGDDEGRSRVTIRTHQIAWQGVFDEAGDLLSERQL